MKLLSLDLSTKSSGWAIFEDEILLKYGCIKASSTDLYKRINKIINELNNIILDYTIDTIVVEEVRPDINAINLNTHRALMFLQCQLLFLLHDNYPNIKIELI